MTEITTPPRHPTDSPSDTTKVRAFKVIRFPVPATQEPIRDRNTRIARALLHIAKELLGYKEGEK